MCVASFQVYRTSLAKPALTNGSWPIYRSTTFDYNTPLVTSAKYIVGLPARQQVLSPSGILLGERINLYDGNTSYSGTISAGKLTGQRTLLSCVNEDCTTAANLRYSDVSYGYDAWGNRVRTTAYDLAGTSSTPFRGNAVDTYTCYGTQATLGGRSCTNDGYHTYPLWTRNALGQDTNWTYYYARGVPLTETDPNGAVTTAQYDNFGRITSITRPGDEGAGTLTMSYTASYPFTTTITQRIDAAQSYQVVRQYDGMGRQMQINSGGAITDTIYTSAKITQQRVPYLAGDPAPSLFYKTTADPDAQTVRVDAPDGTYTITTTDGFTTQVKDQRNNQTETAVDEWGRVVSVIPPTGPRVTYTYDRFNRLLTAARGGVTTTLTYDKAGRKTSMADPDMGYWSYGYNPLGNLTRQTDARGQRICLYYDPLSRLTGKHYRADDNCPENRPDPADVMYGYDQGTNGTGHRTNMTDASGSTAWTYDARGRVLTETKTITGGGPFVTQWEYNSADLPVTMTYPDLEQVTYEYNSRMLLNTVTGTSPYVMADTNGNGSYYDAAGRLTSRLLGNGLTQAFTYYGWAEQATVNGAQTGQGGRLKNLTVGSLQNLTYKYDEAGNVKEIANSVAPETQGYDYDALNRLTGWTLDGVQKTYSYNTAGNLSAKEGVALTYGDSSHPHAATASGSNSYSYDANGNMTLRGPAGQQFALAYDAEGRLVTVSGPSGFSAAFTYDGDGQRVKQVIGGTTTYFVGNYCEKTGSTITKYYYAGATRIGMRKYTIPQSMVVEYFLGDHLGSTSITTDNAGAKVSEMRYKPFGEVRYTWKDATLTQTTPAYALTRWTFTGQYSDSYINLLWYGSRHYDPELGRFISPDSIVPVAVQGVQAWDRYAYANNSPLNYVDPTGHFGQCHDGQSGYACRITQNKVAALRNQWAAEVAARAALLQATRANASLNDLLNCRDRVCESGVVGPSKIEPGNPFVCSSSICNPRSRAAPQTRDERTSVSQMPDDSSLLVALAAGLLTIKLGILDTVLAYAIISVAITSVTVPGAQIGLIGELVLIPLEAASLNLTIVAAEMALSGDTNVDMLPLVHVLFPDFMPYQP